MKRFFETFHTLSLDNKIRVYFEDVIIDRVHISHASNSFNICITSEHLLSRKHLRVVAKAIEQQLFPPMSNIHVYFEEHYSLNQQYTVENIFNLYNDNIEAEVNTFGSLHLKVYRDIKKVFSEDNNVTFAIGTNPLVYNTAVNVAAIVRRLFHERFNSDIEITILVDETLDNNKEQEQLSRIDFNNKVDEIRKNLQENGSMPAPSVKADEDVKPEDKNDKKKKDYYKNDDPAYLYGKTFDGDETDIIDLAEASDAIVRGKIIQYEPRELRSGKVLIIMAITDFTDTIKVKLFAVKEQADEIAARVGNVEKGKGIFVKVKGYVNQDKYDNEVSISNVIGIKEIPNFTKKRVDTSPIKRIELHAHTKMSDNDSVVGVKDLVNKAIGWGHEAIAITDHGVVQAFPDANHVVEDYDKGQKKLPPEERKPFKVIYGVEAYVVDDLKPIVIDNKNQELGGTYVVFDIETTGFSPVNNRIIEIGAVKVANGEIIDRFSTFVNPKVPIPLEIEQLTSITDDMVMEAPTIKEILPDFLKFCEGAVLVAHNAAFDTGFIKENAKNLLLSYDFTAVDTVPMARAFLPELKNYKLDTVADELKISLDHHHRAVDDAECTALIFIKLCEFAKNEGINNLTELDAKSGMSSHAVKRAKSFHAVILIKNETGRVNLYRLVSESHLNYFQRRPRIPKSLLQKYREGLIVSSACSAGEVFSAVLEKRSDDEIKRLVDFYDYLEIQPIGNNRYLFRDKKHPDITNDDDLIELNKKIVELGELYNKPVVATCDVHFMEPEDDIYRKIIMHANNYDDAMEQPPVFLRTTEEMLDEFRYLGDDKAKEVVITNTHKISDMIEKISPVSPDKCPPVIPHSDETLTEICYNKAHEIYGENLPEIVEARLKKELNSIISNGFAVMYIIAQKLVWKSISDGYLVGSRGSVGSSFVAFLAGITEVNSLQAHYLCPKCKYVDFDSEYVQSFSGRSGCDMEDRTCPVCGAPLNKEGHDIPFETFLGFEGNKEPDIDLNFSGEYQSKAHSYTEVIFGHGQTFRAGTIGGVAEKTAIGYAKKYFESTETVKRNCEMVRIAKGCEGVKRTTGQHPGGIVVLPLGEEIYRFTPVQHPANLQTTKIVTTHFDYHSIDHNLLKLDILGHDDPTMVRMLQDITGIDPKGIGFDDKKVLSLFLGLDALGIKPEDIGGTTLGSLGIPEFGTDFVMQMLKDTKPQAFSDLVRISGLSHGTDVWLNNAQYWINEGKATISTAICTRDDIMIYLIGKQMDPERSFKIMESVRKGKGLNAEWEQEMAEHDVPEWYIESCRRIKYMFPKAHAVAYVMMGFRIAWFKVYHPLAYYAAYFSIRATAFNYELMCNGKEALDRHIKAYKANPDLSQKEEDTLKDMRIVQEFYARGFEFLPISLYDSEAVKFKIVDGKLLPPFISIEGMGANAAESLYNAAKEGEFLSRDEVKQRGKVTSTIVEKMNDMGLLKELPQSSQMSIFDMM